MPAIPHGVVGFFAQPEIAMLPTTYYVFLVFLFLISFIFPVLGIFLSGFFAACLLFYKLLDVPEKDRI